MGTRTKVLAVSALAAAGALLALTSAALGAARSGVTIERARVMQRHDRFEGFVFSQKPAQCANARTVKLFKQKGKTPNPKQDKKIGKTTSFTNSGGSYRWIIYQHPRPGNFYARIPRTSACQGDNSKAAHISKQVNTKITDAGVDRYRRTAGFAYDGVGGFSPHHFRCKLDKRHYQRCGDQKAYRNLSRGRHVFKVYAIDAKGKRDPTPAKFAFTIPR
jgi:hypothetical protein